MGAGRDGACADGHGGRETSARLYDGVTVVAEGDTQLATAPNGQVLNETTTTTTTKGKDDPRRRRRRWMS